MNRWNGGAKALVVCAGIVFCYVVAGLLLESMLAFGRPPQPLTLGTIQWLGEAGATVDGVDRVAQIGTGRNAVRARGVFYIVHARIIAPFGMRPTWHDSDVSVDTYAHSGATLGQMHFDVDEHAQAALDKITHRPGKEHEVRGAQQHEDLVFDMPVDVEQPGLVFIPANDPAGMLDILFGSFWQPHRFNLRYD